MLILHFSTTDELQLLCQYVVVTLHYILWSIMRILQSVSLVPNVFDNIMTAKFHRQLHICKNTSDYLVYACLSSQCKSIHVRSSHYTHKQSNIYIENL